MGLKVNVTYKNRNLKTVQECEYDLSDYATMLGLDLKRIITDIEDMVYLLNGNKSKDDWTEDEIRSFNKIKHKLLDKAGEIERLPHSIYDERESSPTSRFWDRMFNKGE